MICELTEDLRSESNAKNNLKYKFEQALGRGISALNIENTSIQQEITTHSRFYSESNNRLITPEKIEF